MSNVSDRQRLVLDQALDFILHSCPLLCSLSPLILPHRSTRMQVGLDDYTGRTQADNQHYL